MYVIEGEFGIEGLREESSVGIGLKKKTRDKRTRPPAQIT
jgi:hypothetical protein